MVLSDNETRIDRLNNMAIAKTIVSIIRESKESVSIGVHGDWGAGKSSILVMVEDELKSVMDCTELENSDNTSGDEEESILDYVSIRFNSWQYQGFEDAKIALMSAIVSQLEISAENYCKKHKIKGGIEEVKKIGSRIWKNLDKLSIAKNIGKIGVSIATGTAPIVLIEILANIVRETVTDPEKAGNMIGMIGDLIKEPSPESSSYKEMEEFRNNYKELFEKAHVRKLVVLIDDLDRCLPKVAIETLEAVRMFLTLDSTAFVIAADDAMIRYSVKEYFPRVLEQDTENLDAVSKINYSRFSDKYLEKLIQIPLHIPRIGIAEAQLYVLLLLVEAELGECEELKNLEKIVIIKLHKPWALESLSTTEIKKALGNKYDNAIERVKIAQSIDRILAENTSGNPRNIKRFINMLLLRTEVAQNRGFESDDLEMAVLAKMMLAEQYNGEFYKALAGELNEEGHCTAFEGPFEEDNENITEKEKVISSKTKQNNSVKPKNDIKVESMTKSEAQETQTIAVVKNDSFKAFLNQEDVKAWMQIEPSLVGKDLRPYFFACTEKVDFFFVSTEERLRELISVVRAGKFNTLKKKKDIQKLDDSDAKRLMRIVFQDVFTRNLSKNEPPKSIEGIRVLVEYRPELQGDLVDLLMTLPFDKLGIWSVGGWDACIPRTSDSRIKLKQFFKSIEENSTNTIITSTAKSAQE
nr:Qat anti-phage system ATPase QatA [uncultured Clostridium sp.]